MADINQTISLGIGTPADIPHFILWGLSPAAAAGVDYATEDLTTAWAMYCDELVAATQGTGGYLNEEARTYLNAVRGATGEVEDLNTAVWLDLTK